MSSPELAQPTGNGGTCRIDFGIQAASRSAFPSNYISTTKYEWWNIIPKNLLEQFQRAANVWFLAVSIFQMLPLDLSPTNKYATLVPLVAVLLVTFCKDAFEDYRRRQDDHRINNQKTQVVDLSSSSTTLKVVRWKDVTVGSYIKLERDDPVPADIILLSCSHADGIIYVDTAQLDGETSLKPKFAVETTMHMVNNMDLEAFRGHIEAEPPNEYVQSFSAMIYLQGVPRGIPVDLKNVVLRGSTLRNTEWALGVVVYAGVDTKLVRNARSSVVSKRSFVEVTANRLLVIVFGLLLMSALAMGISRAAFTGAGWASVQISWVWPGLDPLKDSPYLAFITFLVGFNNLIPISLYMTMDLVRAAQAIMMERDGSMYHGESDTYCKVKNSALCEDLGQVEFVMSDKTGTLTQNMMRFKACYVGGQTYGCWDQARGPVDRYMAMPPTSVCAPLSDVLRQRSMTSTAPPSEITDLENSVLNQFFLCMATCHAAIPEKVPEKPEKAPEVKVVKRRSGADGPEHPEFRPDESAPVLEMALERSAGLGPRDEDQEEEDGSQRERALQLRAEAHGLVYRSPSPDEEALVSIARDFGFFFRRKIGNKLLVNVRGVDRLYKVVLTNDFSSERKRMSILLRQLEWTGQSLEEPVRRQGSLVSIAPNQKEEIEVKEEKPIEDAPYILYAKGADSIMIPRLLPDGNIAGADAQLKRFASYGLRTLVCAKRELSESEAESFVQRVQEAKGAFMNRDKLLDRVLDEMERNMELLGVTAVEDKIQDGVPETIEMMLAAGIKVWMLTGDSVETAVNIAVMCRLVDFKMKQYMINPQEATASSLQTMLERYYTDISSRIKAEVEPGSFKYCIIVHGQMLYTILDESNMKLRQLFLAIACSSNSVIASRLAPAQKGALVELVRNSVRHNPLVLAVGDGGNDVSMIQKAHVGVGILGAEGREAANAADFAIAQFRFLRSLLLVHGRWNLRRISIVIGYSFYKNFLLVVPMIIFSPFTAFSGTTLFDSYYLMLYNVVFTSLPIFSTGILDVDLFASTVLAVPRLYELGIRRVYFNAMTLTGWLARGLLHAGVNFAVMCLVLGPSVWTGSVTDYYVIGSWSYWTCTVIANVTLLLHTEVWMDWQLILLILSAFGFIPVALIYSSSSVARILTPPMEGTALFLFSLPASWLALALTITFCAATDLTIRITRRLWAPNMVNFLQEFQLGNKVVVQAVQGWSDLDPVMPFPPDVSPRARTCEGNRTMPWKEVSVDVAPTARHELPSAAQIAEFAETLPKLPPREHHLRALSGASLEPLRGGKQTSWQANNRVIPSEAIAEPEDVVEHMMRPPPLMERAKHFVVDCFHWVQEMQWQEIMDNQALAAGEFEMLRTISRMPAKKQKPGCNPVRTLSATENLGPIRTILGIKSPLAVVPEAVTRSEWVYSVVTLQFLSTQSELLFRQKFGEQSVTTFRWAARFLSFSATIVGGLTFVGKAGKVEWLRIVAVCCCIPAGELAVLLMHTPAVRQHPENYLLIVSICVLILKHILDILIQSDGVLENAFVPVFTVVAARVRFPRMCFVILVHHILLILRYRLFATQLTNVSVPVQSAWGSNGLYPEYFFLQLGVSTLSLCYSYLLERFTRERFALHESLKLSRWKAIEMLSGMFPEEVVKHITSQLHKQQQQQMGRLRGIAPNDLSLSMGKLQQDRGIVTVLFCDIVDFERLVKSLPPLDLVQLLDRAFMMFDRICEENDITKIETVGKTYMAAGMPKDTKMVQNKGARIIADARNALMAAIGILRLVKERTLGVERISKIAVRIGIHTGPVISGVVGSRKPQFALFGDTVNTAARMQSTGETNHVHISASTYSYVSGDSRFSWEEREIFAKGKGKMNTYLLVGHHNNNKQARPRQALLLGSNASIEVVAEVQERRVALNHSDSMVIPMSRSTNMTRVSSGGTSKLKRFQHRAKRHFQDLRELFFSLAGSTSSLENVSLRPLWASFFAFWLCHTASTLCVLFGDDAMQSSRREILLAIRCSYSLASPPVVFLTWWICSRRLKKKLPIFWIPQIIDSIVFCGFLSSTISNFVCLNVGTGFWPFFEAFFFAIVAMHFLLLFPSLFSAMLYMVVNITVLVAAKDWIAYRLYPEAVSAVQLFTMYKMKDFQLKATAYLTMRQQENERVHQLLSSLVPAEVLAELQSDSLSLAYEYKGMMLLFADIVGFTSYCSNHTAEEAVNLVTRLFAEFDDSTAKLGVYKVCTIGDAYVAVNEPQSERNDQDKAEDGLRVMLLALDMLKAIAAVREEVNHSSLDMRIGLHHGSFTAGIIGTNQLRFDIWGEDVLIGNSLESSGLPGQICVSLEAKMVLERVRPGACLFEFYRDLEQDGRTIRTFLCKSALSGNRLAVLLSDG